MHEWLSSLATRSLPMAAPVSSKEHDQMQRLLFEDKVPSYPSGRSFAYPLIQKFVQIQDLSFNVSFNTFLWDSIVLVSALSRISLYLGFISESSHNWDTPGTKGRNKIKLKLGRLLARTVPEHSDEFWIQQNTGTSNFYLALCWVSVDNLTN